MREAVMSEPVRLIHAYARLMDERDFDGVAALFTDDAEIDYATLGSTIHGSAALAAFLHRQVGGGTLATSHHVSNIDVDVAPEGDSADAVTYLYAWHRLAKVDHYEVWGRYHDRLVLLPDVGWRFAARRLHVTAERGR
jgi:3-phenylpropionate/cinnamic acid dioxygenase small subunit